MAIVHAVLADVCVGIAEFKKNPMAVVAQGDGGPVAIMNRSKPVFYAIPAKAFERIMDRLEDIELAEIVRARKGQPEIEVDITELYAEKRRTARHRSVPRQRELREAGRPMPRRGR